MGFRVVEVQPTPNPQAMKYVLDRSIGETPASFFTADAAEQHPIASQLFAIPGVAGVLLLKDFATVSKLPAAKWAAITPAVRKVLRAADDPAPSP